ncbi:hypothetical protein FRB91_010126 [Serendipita sp. 411]|nr:hypothetical protein FRB91_010126 [Serendipita sp. 411]
MIMMLQPTKNDSTSTISPIPPNIGLDNPSVALITDSRASSSSELSSMFAYKPPMGFHDGRGAFDRPPASGIVGINNLHAHNANSVSYGGSSRRPASAGNPSPLRPALKRPRHHTSNSTGTLYVPEMPSPLSQPPKLSIVDQSQNPQSSSQSLPHTPYTSSLNLSAPMTVTMARKISMGQQTADNLSRSSSVGLRSKMGPPTAYRDRPSSSGKSSTLSPPAAAVPKRPSTAGGAFTISLKDSSLSVPPSRVASSGNTTAQNRANTITKGPVSISKGFPKASGRPSTAPHPTPKGRSEELSRSSSFFKKKPKAEKSTPQKRSWFRFW